MLHPRDRRVGICFDDRYLQHDSGEYLISYRDRFPYAEPVPHLSSPAILQRAKHLIDLYELSRLMRPISAREATDDELELYHTCLLYTSPSPRDRTRSRMPSSA